MSSMDERDCCDGTCSCESPCTECTCTEEAKPSGEDVVAALCSELSGNVTQLPCFDEMVGGCTCHLHEDDADGNKSCACYQCRYTEAGQHIYRALDALGLWDKIPPHLVQHLKGSPYRIAKAWNEFLCNVGSTMELPTMFNAASGDMIVVKNNAVRSMCSHHFFPFYGVCHVAYIPGEKLVGLSKIPRIVNHFSKMPQVQEELTAQIADYIFDTIGAKFVYVRINGVHTCCTVRGVEASTEMVTAALRASDNVRNNPALLQSYKSEAVTLLNS